MSSDHNVSPPQSLSNSGEIVPGNNGSTTNPVQPGEIVQASAEEDNKVISRNHNEEKEVPDNNGSTTNPLQPGEIVQASAQEDANFISRNQNEEKEVPGNNGSTTNPLQPGEIVQASAQEDNKVISRNHNEEKEVPGNNGSTTNPVQPGDFVQASAQEDNKVISRNHNEEKEVPDNNGSTTNPLQPGEIVQASAQEDANFISRNQNEEKEVPGNNGSTTNPLQPGEIVQASAQEDNNVISRNQNEEKEVPDNNGSTTNTLQPGEIVQASDQEDNNVISINQNEEKEVSYNNGSTTNPLQPHQVKAKENGVARSTEALLNLISREVEYIKGTSKTLGVYKDIVGERIPGAEKKIEQFERELREAGEKEETHEKFVSEIEKELRQFKKHVRKLKLPIPPKFKINPEDLPALEQHLSGSNKSLQPFSIGNKLGKLELFKEKINYEHRSAFQDFEKRYAALDNQLKLCLLCFSMFPEDQIIKKRLMVYWWIGEGFITPENQNQNVNENERNQNQEDLEQRGAKCFDTLIENDFIHSADGKGSQEVDNCKMQPFVRWAVILMAEKAKFFKFNDDGIPTEDYDSSFRACLVGNGLDIEKNPNLEKLHMLCNVNEEILELKPEWFMKMKNVSALCLGRWQAAAGHHIEVEETNFLDGLKNMLHLRYLSLQGISRITKLPNSLSQLGKLTILDLRACHNLEELPSDIGFLRRLTHLDLSECYLLAHMPKGISKLANLLVLKGFLVVEHAKDKSSCTLDDLTKLTKLRKLSIFTGLAKFPEAKDLDAFKKFNVLRKLKIVWGEQHDSGPDDVTGKRNNTTLNVENRVVSSRNTVIQTPADGHTRERKVEKALSVLEKLDLQCFPKKSAPYWLTPSEMSNLKKLYIRGGQLRDLVVDDHDWEVRPWNVETLRLKYLTGLRMNWTELLELFPQLIYLEKLRCPKLTLFPCDDQGVWVKKKMI